MLPLIFLTSIAALIVLLYIVVRIWKRSALLAIVSFFFPPLMIFPLFRYWGDDEGDIKVPFFILLVLVIVQFNLQLQLVKAHAPQQESFLAIARFLA
jgi:Na+-driven multidrug efflux pump